MAKKDIKEAEFGLEDTDIELARRELLEFTQLTKEDYQTNWHHELIAEKLDKFVNGEIKRLMIFVPPRHGKSELASRRLPAFILGKRPDSQIIACSYGADLAARMNRDVQRVIDSPAYRKIFPETRLWEKNIRTVADGSYLRNSETFEIVNRKGVYRCAGVGGAITGMGADFLIIDDPIKNQEEALSPTYRQKVWDWYTSTAFTRLEKEGSVLVIQTRWHEDDLSGRLLALAESDPDADQWEVIDLPAIKETDDNPEDPRQIDEALWPEKYSEERLLKIKISVGSYFWGAMYQQTPTVEGGNIINRNWWRYYSTPFEKYDYVMQSWDCSFGKTGNKNSFVVGQVWGKLGAKKHLLDQVRERMTYVQTKTAIKKMKARWPESREIIVEEAANGHAIIEELQADIAGVIGIRAKDSKEARLHAVSPQIEAGCVYLPDPLIAKWVPEFLEEISAFPSGKFDDQVDATSQALERMESTAQYAWFEMGEEMAREEEENRESMSPQLKEQLWGV